MNEPLKAMIERHEGRRDRPYLDSQGVMTVGIGHNLRDRPLSQRVIDMIFEDDYEDALRDAQSIPTFTLLDQVRQDVLVDMVFNMGIVRLRGFKNLFAALDIRDFKEAAAQMRDSIWATQVGNRAQELSKMMQTGVYQTGG